MAFIWFFADIRYIRALREGLLSCAPENRAIDPDRLWLEMLPIVGFFWQLKNVIGVSTSLGNEVRDRGAPSGRPGLGRGVTMVALQMLALIFIVTGGVGMGIAMPADGSAGPWPGLTVVGIILLLGSFLLWSRYWRLVVDRIQPRFLGE